MRWRVSLAGEQPDLFALVRMFPTGAVHVVQDHDQTYLMGPALDVETQAGKAYQLTERWLRQINGAATALRSGDYWYVALGDRICDADAPQNVYVMAGAATAVARALAIAEAQVIGADGQVVPPPQALKPGDCESPFGVKHEQHPKVVTARSVAKRTASRKTAPRSAHDRVCPKILVQRG
jgi:hypothetical protein